MSDPRERVPVTIPARDEARSLGACLRALARSIAHAEEHLPLRFEVCVVGDRCVDDTLAIARAHGALVRESAPPYGKVEALRAGLRPGPFALFLDADVLVADDTVRALATELRTNPSRAAVSPPFAPTAPSRDTALARALYVYNLRRGFSSARRWISGRCFATRWIELPTSEEVSARQRRHPPDAFLDGPMVAEDVWLSRALAHRFGLDALGEVQAEPVRFRPPETLRGMYRYWRRLRRELERVDRLFPELTTEIPRREPDLLGAATADERRDYEVFSAALALCRGLYRAERAWVRRTGLARDPWPAIAETKRGY